LVRKIFFNLTKKIVIFKKETLFLSLLLSSIFKKGRKGNKKEITGLKKPFLQFLNFFSSFYSRSLKRKL